MKGLEGMPIRLMVVSLILVIIIGVAFWEMNYFMEFKTEKDFKEGVVSFAQTVKNLKSTGDFGAFTTISMIVPSGFTVSIDMDNDTVTGSLTGENYSVDMTDFSVNISAVRLEGDAIQRNETVLMDGGITYSLMLYYGRLDDEEVKEFTVVFE
jgi:hypothetical protein